jgi:hypothetical protein
MLLAANRQLLSFLAEEVGCVNLMMVEDGQRLQRAGELIDGKEIDGVSI